MINLLIYKWFSKLLSINTYSCFNRLQYFRIFCFLDRRDLYSATAYVLHKILLVIACTEWCWHKQHREDSGAHLQTTWSMTPVSRQGAGEEAPCNTTQKNSELLFLIMCVRYGEFPHESAGNNSFMTWTLTLTRKHKRNLIF